MTSDPKFCIFTFICFNPDHRSVLWLLVWFQSACIVQRTWQDQRSASLWPVSDLSATRSVTVSDRFCWFLPCVCRGRRWPWLPDPAGLRSATGSWWCSASCRRRVILKNTNSWTITEQLIDVVNKPESSRAEDPTWSSWSLSSDS